ncbi:MAG: hypothetical protein WEF50_19810 [Myxococcota bacterium]
MLRVSGFLLGSGLILFAACERADENAAATTDVAAAAPATISGTWKVEGITVEKASGTTRQISGTIILAEEGGAYHSTFDLSTTFPSEGGPTHADVIGEGEGTVEGRNLAGTARTQIVVAGTPNLDPAFAFVPRRVGTRIVSTTKGTLAEDGTISLEIESEPAPGETYAATRTTLKGSFAAPLRTPSEP